jgi:Uma2 family endonuclease
MAMPAQPMEWTVEMVHALPDDGKRYEVIDGELFVTPAPSLVHQRAVRELLYVIGPYATAHGIGDALMAPADIVYGPRKMVQPDLFVVPFVGGAPPRAWTEVGHLILAVEVLSPSTSRVDRGKKRDLYREKGVPQYWIVDIDSRTIDRWRPDDMTPETRTDLLAWQPDQSVEPLVIDVAGYFARVHGEAQRRA